MNAKRAWVDGKYNTSRLVLSPGINVTVEWANAGYKVSFCGTVVLKARFKSMDDAKDAGIILARKQLNAAAYALPVDSATVLAAYITSVAVEDVLRAERIQQLRPNLHAQVLNGTLTLADAEKQL